MEKKIGNYKKNYSDIIKYYNYLLNQKQNEVSIGKSNELIIDNYSHLQRINDYIKTSSKQFKRDSSKLEKINTVLKKLVVKKKYNITKEYLIKSLNQYQSSNNYILTYKELRNIKILLIFLYVDKLNDLCRDEYIKLLNAEDIANLIRKSENVTISTLIPANFDINNNFHYIYELNSQINLLDNNSQLFKLLHEYLKVNGFVLKDIINEESQDIINNNVMISNIFSNLEDILNLSQEYIYANISKTEQELMTDKNYQMMTTKSKQVYRNVLEKTSKKHHKNEYNYLREIDSDEHIGYKLINNSFKGYYYILSILISIIIPIITSWIISAYFPFSRTIIYPIILLPLGIFEFNILKFIILKSTKNAPILKIDYTTNEIPISSQTLVSVYETIYDLNDIDSTFNYLEELYIKNKNNNIVYALLGDVTSSKEKETSHDEKIAKYGREYADKLNNKYKTKVFNFLYRKRVRNKKENIYMGYEGQRGYINQLNKILVGEEVDIEKHFYENTLSNKKTSVKYVVNINKGEELSYESIIEMIGAMDHPLNSPQLNKKKNRVIRGYALMQPKIYVNNKDKTLYGKVSPTIENINNNSDLHQRLLGQGIFAGSGIYDLEIYHELTNELFQNNTILDSNEFVGDLLRCAYDSEVIVKATSQNTFLKELQSKICSMKNSFQNLRFILMRIKDKNKEKKINPFSISLRLRIISKIVIIFSYLFFIFGIITLIFNTNLNSGIGLLGIILLVFIMIASQKPKNIILGTYVYLVTIPCYIYYYFKELIITIYRMIYTHNGMLKQPSLKEEKMIEYQKVFVPNCVFSILLIILGIIKNNYISYILAFSFVSAPFIIYLMSHNKKSVPTIKEEQININSTVDKIPIDYINDNKYIRLSNHRDYTIMSNQKYAVLINDEGEGYSRYRNVQLNKYDPINNKKGLFLLVKNIKNNQVWSNTYAPLYSEKEKYKYHFTKNRIEFIRNDNITTKTEIIVSKSYNAEIRKMSFTNTTDLDQELELTAYTDVLLNNNNSAEFIKTEYDSDDNYILARLSKKDEYRINNYMAMKMYIEEPLNSYSFDTTDSDIDLLDNQLNNKEGYNHDAVVSIRNQIMVKSHSMTTVYIVVGYGRSKNKIKEIVNHFNSTNRLNKEFQIGRLMIDSDYKKFGMTAENIDKYNQIINYIYNLSNIIPSRTNIKLQENNILHQEHLSKFGISGIYPIITININGYDDIDFLYDMLMMYEYFKYKLIFIDMIIINNAIDEEKNNINKLIDNDIYKMNNLNSFYHTPGVISVISNNELTNEDNNLLKVASCLVFDRENTDTIEELQKAEYIHQMDYQKTHNIVLKRPTTLEFDNQYGGFSKKQNEYVIYNKNTPTNWGNLVNNSSFGTIINNDGSGYTYAYDYNNFLLTQNSKGTISEGFRFNNELFTPERCTHGLGYSILKSDSKTLGHSITEFVSLKENVKIYLVELKNRTNKTMTTDIDFFVKPLLNGRINQFTRNIITELDKDSNYINMRNTLHNTYSDVNVFISSSEPIINDDYNKVLEKNLKVSVSIRKKETKQLVFILGCGKNQSSNEKIISKLRTVTNANKELEKVKSHWQEMTEIIKVKTPSISFDKAINGWYLYQAITTNNIISGCDCKIDYQSRLACAINSIGFDPVFSKNQILLCISHQFEEGDVLKSWNDNQQIGVRTKNKADYLWLVYAVSLYIEKTHDYKILNDKYPYIIGDTLSDYENEKEIIFNYSQQSVSVLDHCQQSLDLALSTLGEHNLPLIGTGDWDYEMDMIGYKGFGESVWLGFFTYHVIDKFIKQITKYQDGFDIKKYLKFQKNLAKVLETTWNEDHYIRAYYDNGDKLGSYENNECQIDLATQSYAIISDCIAKEKTNIIFDTIKRELVDLDNNIVKQFSPPFDKTLNNPGKVMNIPKGHSRNGGNVSRVTAWYIDSLIKERKNDEAFLYYQMINPIDRTAEKDKAEKYNKEPYLVPETISTETYLNNASTNNMSSVSSIYYSIGIEKILGLNIINDKLYLNPNPPSDWDSYSILYQYKNTQYKIDISKSKESSLMFDGKIITKDYIKLKNDKKKHTIILGIK